MDSNIPSFSSPSSFDPQKRTEAEEQKNAEQLARQNILVRILSSEARERLSRVALVKEDRARAIEDYLISAVRSGKIRGGTANDGRISETDLVNIINQIEKAQEKSNSTQKIKFQRKVYDDEEEF